MAGTPLSYFYYPFAIDGNTEVVTPSDAPTGDVSYRYGFTPNYELDLTVDPGALPVPRRIFNQVMLDITKAIQVLQQNGAYPWVSPANGGPDNYPIYARVTHDPGAPYGYQVWESQVAGNVSEPGTNTDWAIVSGGRVWATGMKMTSFSPNPMDGFFRTDGTAYSRTTYSNLFNTITFTDSAILNGTNVITVSSANVNLSPGLLHKVEGTGIPAGTYITAVAGTSVTLSAAATTSGTFTLRFFLYGNGDGSTTFNVPNTMGTYGMDAGGPSTTVLGNRLAQTGGARKYMMKLSDLVNHVHEYIRPPQKTGLNKSPVQNTAPAQAYDPLITDQTGNPVHTPPVGQTGMDILPPTMIEYTYIKY